MFAIVLSACLANDPSVCKDYRITLNSNIGPVACVADAPPHFARWAEEHPGWQIKRWRCESASAKDI
jgi:hypothetical protein